MASPLSDEQNAEIERQLADLLRRPIKQLRTQWRNLFRRDPPVSFGRDLLRRSIAYRIQEQAYGGLNLENRRTIDLLVRKLRENPKETLELPRRIKTGSELVRTWNGTCHHVIVGEQGYVYADETYKTLSEIARKITGTRWNGPRFFGLRNPKAEDTPKQKTRSIR
jgi:hypothetical protein